MSTATHVPETSRFGREELSADDARATARRVGAKRLFVDTWRRMRYGDGFSSTRAIAFQFVLALVPLLIAFIGLASSVQAEKIAKALQQTVLSILPGSRDDAFKQALTKGLSSSGGGGRVALVAGLLVSIVAITTAMAQIERGANRIYGVERDRPAVPKYIRAAVLAVTAGLPALIGFLLLVAGRPFGEAAERHWNWPGELRVAWDFVRWPVSLLLIVVAVGVLFKHAPRRRQPGLSWLFFGAVLSTVLWWLASLLLATYVRFGGGFGATYGQLAAIMALLLWANLTGIAFFIGLAFAAQLEARRVGVPRPAKQDTWKPGRELPAPRRRRRRGVSADPAG
jgi:YihY family inner membrane protein